MPGRRIIRAMRGLHLTADLTECASSRAALTDPEALREACIDAVLAAGLRPVGELFHRFESSAFAPPGAPSGVTGVVLLAESHLAVHTWPEIASVTLDVYVCNLGTDNSARAHALLDSLLAAFTPGRVERHALQRGERGSDERASKKEARA
jgi:S-adenosylmethionine decarboxylase